MADLSDLGPRQRMARRVNKEHGGNVLSAGIRPGNVSNPAGEPAASICEKSWEKGIFYAVALAEERVTPVEQKIVRADEAISLVRDRDTLSSCGFVQSCVPETLLKALDNATSTRRPAISACSPPPAKATARRKV